LLAEFAKLVLSATTQGLKDQLSAEATRVQPSLDVTKAELAKIK
jgi:hypothetical protein